MSHLRLMKGDDTTIRDGEHELYVYSVSVWYYCACVLRVSRGAQVWLEWFLCDLVQGPAEEPREAFHSP